MLTAYSRSIHKTRTLLSFSIWVSRQLVVYVHIGERFIGPQAEAVDGEACKREDISHTLPDFTSGTYAAERTFSTDINLSTRLNVTELLRFDEWMKPSPIISMQSFQLHMFKVRIESAWVLSEMLFWVQLGY